MKASTLARLEQAERSVTPAAPPRIEVRIGRITKSTMPPGYVGETHLVAELLPEPDGAAQYRFEERPGPDPAASEPPTPSRMLPEFIDVVLVAANGGSALLRRADDSPSYDEPEQQAEQKRQSGDKEIRGLNTSVPPRSAPDASDGPRHGNDQPQTPKHGQS